MDVLLATFQGVTIEASSTGHIGQVKVFEQLSLLVRTLASSPPEVIAANRAHTEKALKDLVLGEFGSKEGLMTLAFLELVRDAFTLLYQHGDSKDMLGLAGDFQDAVSKGKKTLSSAQASACMYALAGISRSKGKALAGHLSDTVAITETTLTPRSKQTLMKIASLAVSSVSSVTATSPALRKATVDALTDGLIGAGEAGRSTWPSALKVLTRASVVKSSVAVRESGVKGFIALANVSPEPVDKLVPAVIAGLNDSALSVRILSAEALGACLGTHRKVVNWGSSSSIISSQAEAAGSKKVSLENLSWKTPLNEAIECLINAFHSSSASIDFKQAITRSFVSFLDRLPPASSVDDISSQIDWGLRFASTEQIQDKTENVLCASYVLRAGIGSRAPERLQLAAAKHLIQICSSSDQRLGSRRCAFIELQHLIATLGEGFSSLGETCIRCCDSIDSSSTNSPALLHESSATLRSLVLCLPEMSSSLSSKWLETLVMSQSDVNKIEQPVRALSAIIRGAASLNRGGALPTTHLFGMGKALASRHLDQDSDPTGQFGSAGWDLLDSLFTLGPSFYAPHLPQLFALWQETFRSSKNEQVLSSSVNALGALLRNANEDDFILLGRAASALLITIPISFISKKSTRFQACIFESWSKCSNSQLKPDQNILVLALHHMTCLDCKTSLLDVGGLLNAQDEVLDFDSANSEQIFLSDGRTLDTFMETILFKVNPNATPQESRDCFDSSSSLHALVGRRARSRPSLGQRLKSAGGGGGGANSEASLPSADPRAIPSGQTWAQRVVDASITYFATYFANGDARVKLEALSALIAKFGGIPHHANTSTPSKSDSNSNLNSNNQSFQNSKPFNVVTCLLACMKLCNSESEEGREISEWQTIQRDFLVGFLSNPNCAIRRASAEALSLFSTKLASPEISNSIQICLEGALKATGEDESTNNFKCGALLASARMKRDGKDSFRFNPGESAIYEACKLTTQPVRVWSLHSWNLIVSSSNPSDAHRYVRPTSALINAHLLAEAGSPTHESTSAHSATLFCLSRLCNTVLSCLGPELSSDEDRATRLFSVWDALRRRCHFSFEIQRQLLIFCELFALFHPKFIFEDLYKRSIVQNFVLERLNSNRENLNSVFNAGINCILRLCERDWTFSKNRSRVFESLERCGRAHPNPAFSVISPTLGSWSLRFSWSKSDMTGAPGPSCSSRWSYFYPPEREEQVCYVIAEMIRTGGSAGLGEWFGFCRDVVSGGSQNKQEDDNGDESNATNGGGGGEESINNKNKDAILSIDDESAAMMREPRWQTKTVSLEGLHAVVRAARASGAEHMDLKRIREVGEVEPIVKSLESLVSCAGQAATATVGDVGISTLQARGLACLSRIVTIFAPQNDPIVPEFPLLRQYEAQINATLRPGLSPKAQAELSREATILAANVLVTGVSTSARRLIGQLIIKGLGGKEEEEEGGFKSEDDFQDDDEDGGGGGGGGPGGISSGPVDVSTFGSVDDVASSSLLLTKSSALARLALAAGGQASAAFEDDVAQSDQVFRDDTRVAIQKALTTKIHTQLVKIWVRIVRDYFILSQSSISSRAPKRHPDATYESGRTPQDVAALLPAYSEAWMVCAQAAASAVDTEFWSLTSKDFNILVFGCTRAVEIEESPLRSIDALATLISKSQSWKQHIDLTFERELLEVLANRSLKASQRGKNKVRDACFNCISVLLKQTRIFSASSIEFEERLWIRVFETCVQAGGLKVDVLDRMGLADCCPEGLLPMISLGLCSSILSKKSEQIESCAKVLQSFQKRISKKNLIPSILKDLFQNRKKSNVDILAVLQFLSNQNSISLSKSFHEQILACMNDIFINPASNEQEKRLALKSIGDWFRKGHVEEGRYYARELLSPTIEFFIVDSQNSMETFKNFMEIWARVVVMGQLETNGLIALANALAQDNLKAVDEKRQVAWGKFFLLVAKENSAAFKNLVNKCNPEVKGVLEETVRFVMARS